MHRSLFFIFISLTLLFLWPKAVQQVLSMSMRLAESSSAIVILYSSPLHAKKVPSCLGSPAFFSRTSIASSGNGPVLARTRKCAPMRLCLPLALRSSSPPPPPGQVPTKDLVLSFSFTLSVCSFQSIIDIFSFLLSSARPGTLFGEKASLICRIALDLFWTEKNVDLETCAPSAQLRSKGRLVVSSTCGKHQRGSTLVGPYRNPLPNRPRKATFLLVLLAFSKSRPTAGFRI